MVKIIGLPDRRRVGIAAKFRFRGWIVVALAALTWVAAIYFLDRLFS